MEWSEADAKIFDDVQQYGWHVMIVADQPPFAYTIGLYARFKRPELVVFGLRTEDLHAVCNAYGEQVKKGEEPTPEAYLQAKAVLLPVSERHVDAYLGTAQWFYRGQGFPAVQLAWADPSGHFPWEEGCLDAVRTAQPILSS
jgi:hypothetical protein